MSKITRYTVESDRNYLDFEQKVNNLIQSGWQPRGEIVITSTIDSDDQVYTWYYQVMVTNEDNEDN